jgi:anti-sigma factor RsiW
MTTDPCAQIRELAPELALGIADGKQRAAALEHLAACPECRAHVESLARVADELLLVAPAAEPPLGFEDRVATRLAPPAAAPPARRRRIALTAAAAAGAAIIAAGAVWLGTASDRELASDYRAALDRVDGDYFATGALADADGGEVGDVFAYDGQHSWVYVLTSPVDGAPGLAPGRYDMELAGGSRPPVELSMEIDADGAGAGGGEIEGGLAGRHELRVLDAHGDTVATAALEH